MSSARRIVSTACAVCAVLAIGGGIAACGEQGSPADAPVARVGTHSISRRTLDHWTDVEAVLAYDTDPKRPVPNGVVPDPPTFTKCVAYLEGAGSEPGRPPLTRPRSKQRCQEKHAYLRRHVLDILIFSYWLHDEGAQRGVKVTNAEVKKTLDRAFPNEAAYRRYLSLTGETPADERLIVEKDLLDTRLLQLAEAKTKPKNAQEHEKMLRRLASAFTRKWKRRTSCTPGYVVAECKQYTGPPSLLAP